MSISRRSFLRGSVASGAVLSLVQVGCGNEVVAAETIDVAVDDDSASPCAPYGSYQLRLGFDRALFRDRA